MITIVEENKNNKKKPNDDVNDLKEEIIKIQDLLKDKVDEKGVALSSTEVIELSHKLDEIIVEYMKNEKEIF